MAPGTDSIGKDDAISFLNRDHIVSVIVHHGGIVVTTTRGDKITIAVSATTVEKFVDDLASSVQSNFVAVAAEPRVVG